MQPSSLALTDFVRTLEPWVLNWVNLVSINAEQPLEALQYLMTPKKELRTKLFEDQKSRQLQRMGS